MLVLSLGGGTTGHDGGIAVDAHFDLVRHERLEIHAPGFAVLEVLRPILDHATRAVMNVVLVQDLIKDGDIRLDDGLIEVLDELNLSSRSSLAGSPSGSVIAVSLCFEMYGSGTVGVSTHAMTRRAERSEVTVGFIVMLGAPH